MMDRAKIGPSLPPIILATPRSDATERGKPGRQYVALHSIHFINTSTARSELSGLRTNSSLPPVCHDASQFRSSYLRQSLRSTD